MTTATAQHEPDHPDHDPGPLRTAGRRWTPEEARAAGRKGSAAAARNRRARAAGIDPPGRPSPPDDYEPARLMWAVLGARLRAHAIADAAPTVAELSALVDVAERVLRLAAAHPPGDPRARAALGALAEAVAARAAASSSGGSSQPPEEGGGAVAPAAEHEPDREEEGGSPAGGAGGPGPDPAWLERPA